MNNRSLFLGAFVLGALSVAWVGIGFIGSNYLAFAMTVMIGAVYGFGALELRQFRKLTVTLKTELASVPASINALEDWLDRVPESLRTPVRLRIEGERIGLPGPALTPYLVGLLVMLGMLGTFVGMVVTFNGAVFALEGTTDLLAIRSALGAPIKGLGLAFGTSVAGVAASAMLGLMSALSRRERTDAAHILDTRIGTNFQRFSLTHQRQETFKAIQTQAQMLPIVVDKLQMMMLQMEQMGQQLNQQLLSNQEVFHSEVKGIYSELAVSVGSSLKESLAQSALLAGESIKPVIEVAMHEISLDANRIHQLIADTSRERFNSISEKFDATATSVADAWTTALVEQQSTNRCLIDEAGRSWKDLATNFEQKLAALLATASANYDAQLSNQIATDQQRLDAWRCGLESLSDNLLREWKDAGSQTISRQQEICTTLGATAHTITTDARNTASTTLAGLTRLLDSSEQLIQSRMNSETSWMAQHHERMDQLVNLVRNELAALRNQEAEHGKLAVERLGELQSTLAVHLTTLGTALEEPITRLIHTASEAPRAAAEVIGQLRQEISHSVSRDNELLEERSRIMKTLNTLLDSINHAAAEQRTVIDALVATSASALDQAAGTVTTKIDTEAAKLSAIAAQVTGSAIEVSSLSESFGFAVQAFNAANEMLIANLQKIETAMNRSTARSDEQLAYYVAQAREIIDLSIMSQKEIVDELRGNSGRSIEFADETA